MSLAHELLAAIVRQPQRICDLHHARPDIDPDRIARCVESLREALFLNRDDDGSFWPAPAAGVLTIPRHITDAFPLDEGDSSDQPPSLPDTQPDNDSHKQPTSAAEVNDMEISKTEAPVALTQRQQINLALQQHGPLKLDALLDKTDIPKASLQAMLSKMAKKGEIRIKAGREKGKSIYSLPVQEDEHAADEETPQQEAATNTAIAASLQVLGDEQLERIDIGVPDNVLSAAMLAERDSSKSSDDQIAALELSIRHRLRAHEDEAHQLLRSHLRSLRDPTIDALLKVSDVATAARETWEALHHDR